MSEFRTLNLAIEFHDLAEGLEIKGHLRDQLFRAASSIALNLSEGNAKPSEKEKKRYYQTAYASCQECKTILRLAKLHELPIAKNLDHLAASVYKLMNARIVTIRRRAKDSGFITVCGGRRCIKIEGQRNLCRIWVATSNSRRNTNAP